MSSHSITSADIPIEGERLKSTRIARIKLLAGGTSLLLSVISLLLLFVVKAEWTGPFAYSWVFAFFFFYTLAAGGIFWTLLHNVSNSSWGTSVRRVMENLGAVYPWMFLFAIPLLFTNVQQYLFEWMNRHRELTGSISGFGSGEALHHSHNPHDHLLYLKNWYLNIPFWYGRMIFYFVGLSAVIHGLRKLSVAQDTDPNPGTSRLFRARFHSTYTLIIFAVTITFAAFDLLMALDYTWFSTMWGVYIFGGSALNSMAVIIITCALLQKAGYMKAVLTPEHYHIKGKLLLAFTIFWGYIAFSQYFLIWYANITEETKYFLTRNTGGWNVGMTFLVFAHFAVPFVILLQAWLKRNPFSLMLMAIYTLVMHVIDHYLIVIPERSISLMNMLPDSYGGVTTVIPGAFWGDILAFAAVGSGFLFFYLRSLEQNALYPHRDPRILESANVSN